MLLDVDRITAGYGEAPVIADVSLSVETGEIVAIIGPNGAGKSTVLRTLAGQVAPQSGKFQFAGEDITQLGIADRGRRGLVFIPQGMNIFPVCSLNRMRARPCLLPTGDMCWNWAAIDWPAPAGSSLRTMRFGVSIWEAEVDIHLDESWAGK
jgi:ABC-type Fe3+/spermidine/putrescine transport system ATPase subunit